MAIHSNILAWEIQWTEEPAGNSPKGCKESSMSEHAHYIKTTDVSIKVIVIMEDI